MERQEITSTKEKLLKPDSNKLEGVAVVYSKVFAGWPWFEVSRGKVCQQFCGPSFPVGSNCPCGCGLLEEAYPKDETIEYIRKELSKPTALGLCFSLNRELKGFGWGYILTSQEFAETKYRLPENQSLIRILTGEDRSYFYISEVGVTPETQGVGLGTKITTALANFGLAKNLPLLLRTNNESPMVKIAQKLGMNLIMGSSSPLLDPENPVRVLFTRQ